MKNFLCLILLIIVSCKNDKNQNSEPAKADTYVDKVVGRVENGEFLISDLEGIKASWETSVRGQDVITPGEEFELLNFEIAKGITEGDVKEDFYMLAARTDEGKIQAAALLELKDGAFYFEKKHAPDAPFYVFIICNGDCMEGCLPVVRNANGKNYLNCSPCIDCMKVENEIR